MICNETTLTKRTNVYLYFKYIFDRMIYKYINFQTICLQPNTRNRNFDIIELFLHFNYNIRKYYFGLQMIWK